MQWIVVVFFQFKRSNNSYNIPSLQRSLTLTTFAKSVHGGDSLGLAILSGQSGLSKTRWLRGFTDGLMSLYSDKIFLLSNFRFFVIIGFAETILRETR